MSKIIIVGGVAGGATAAARLRRLDEHAEIIMFERGEHVSFANCGLPYHIGGAVAGRGDLLLQTPESFRRRFRVDVRPRSEVLSIDRAARTVTVKDRQTGETYCEAYDKLLLSPGGAPIRPPMEGIDSRRVFTLRNVADMDRVKAFITETRPRGAAVAGGGYIGIEMAENLKLAGLDVSIIEMSDQVLAPLDFDMACDVHRHLWRKGIALYLNNGLRKITEHSGGLSLELQNGALEADMLILAVGVRPESRLAKEAGLELNRLGGIVVDKHMRSSDPDIYAVGDAVEITDPVTGQAAMVPLAGPANKQARVAADNIRGIASEYAGTQGSAVVKVFDMTAASTGINEKNARRLGLEYDKVFLWLPGHAGYYPGAKSMSMKVIFERGSGRILGAQIVGFDGVDKRCDLLAVAVRAGMTAHDLTQWELCYAPPYSSAKDPVNMAGYAIENVLTGKVKNFHWHEADALPRDGGVTLLDVREPYEFAQGSMEGFVNVPLDSLRERMGELDKSRPVYLHCHSGMRSYIAARILTQHGFDAYNLSGGYRLYSAVRGGVGVKQLKTAPPGKSGGTAAAAAGKPSGAIKNKNI
ncbi:MAG: FAD-dependent oxidoreductase [Oscillospiraceae bacterium]|nr:FAD-dependent oxidoreductase [Oscillospiraceae bacterium]